MWYHFAQDTALFFPINRLILVSFVSFLQEMILMFLGCILFVATGALAIKTYDGYPGGSNR